MALAAVLAMIAGGGMAHAQGRRGGMVGGMGLLAAVLRRER